MTCELTHKLKVGPGKLTKLGERRFHSPPNPGMAPYNSPNRSSNGHGEKAGVSSRSSLSLVDKPTIAVVLFLAVRPLCLLLSKEVCLCRQKVAAPIETGHRSPVPFGGSQRRCMPSASTVCVVGRRGQNFLPCFFQVSLSFRGPEDLYYR